jgi:hypothetical protein
MMHAALDRLEEILGSPKYFNIVKLQRGSHWIGSLCPMEDCEIYGYVTSSNVKILALIKRESVIPLEKRREVDVRKLFVSASSNVSIDRIRFAARWLTDSLYAMLTN